MANRISTKKSSTKFTSRNQHRAKFSSIGEILEPRHLLAGDLIAHWRADDLVATVANGADVASWKDSKTAIDATASGNPKLLHNGIGGRPALHFDSTNGAIDGFRIRAADSPMRGAANFTVATVFATSSNLLVGNNGPWFENSGLVDSNTNGFSQDWGLTISSQGMVAAGMGGGFGQPTPTVYSNESGLNNGQFHLAVFARAGAAISVSIDGAAPATLNNANISARAPLDMTIGMLQNGVNGFVGDIAQVRIYNGALDAAEISSLFSEANTYYNSPNTAPVASDDSYPVDEDGNLNIAVGAGVIANDRDNESDPLLAKVVSSTANGTLTLNSNGSFTYVPNANFAGSDLFTYTVNDGRAESNLATARIQVRAINDPPAGRTDSYLIDPAVVTSIGAQQGVLANDSDVDGPSLTVAIVIPPNRGTLNLSSDGSFTYQPTTTTPGVDNFTYRVSDSIASSEPIRVDLIAEAPRGTTNPTGDSIVTFNEIQYNPAGLTDERLEWIELHNQMAIDMDISGWRLAGGVSFDFVEGTIILGGGYLVIAANPEQLKMASGFATALGPFVGRLDNGGEEIELQNNSNRILDILNYNDRGDWPEEADGSGATLSKRAGNSASGKTGSWTYSSKIGGTPGAANFDSVPASSTLVINEFESASAAVFRLELANLGSQSVNLSGYRIVSSDDEDRPFQFTNQSIAAGGYLALDQTALGFRPVNEDSLFLIGPDNQTVFDAQLASNRPRGRSSFHSGRWLFPTAPTFGSANEFAVNSAIVINEIMYHSPGIHIESVDKYLESNLQWLELYNRGSAESVDVSGWSFGGISYVFPAGSKIAANQYVVIANDPAGLRASHSSLTADRVFGPFDGNLANGGELVELNDQNGNPVDGVRYQDTGRWSYLADARGSSLELRDPDSDNSIAESWAPSDELKRVGWQTYTYRGVAANGLNSDPTNYNEFVFGLHDEGEILIDDISVIQKPGTAEAVQTIQNGTFEGDSIGGVATKWRIIGNQHGTVVADPDDPNKKVLRLVSTGQTEHMHNHAETTLKVGDTFIRIDRAAEYEISFRARWVGGSNQLNSRMYFNRLSRTTRLPISPNGGTPGAQNSRFQANTGPTYSDLKHSPAVPNPDEAVTVSVNVADPEGVGALTLKYAIDGIGDFTSVAMTRGADGVFRGAIPGQAASKLVQFYVEGQDASGAASHFPAEGPASRALYRVQDNAATNTPLHNLRILMTPADTTFLHELTNVMSNDRIPATVIYKESEIFYNVGVRLKGSEHGRFNTFRVGFNIEFDPEQLFRGVHRTIGVDRSGAGDQYSQKEIIVRQIVNHSGNIPQIYDDLVYVIAPRTAHTGTAMLNLARYNDIFLDSQYQNGSQGTAFEYELIYQLLTTTGGPEGLKRPAADSVSSEPVRGLGDNKELYRWHYIIKNNRLQDNYGDLIKAVTALGGRATDAGFHDRLNEALDVDHWLRSFAVQSLAGIGDNYVGGAGHNAIFYTVPDGKALYFPHDLDFSFTDSATGALVVNGELRKMVGHPKNEHNYYGHVYDILQTTFKPEYMDRWVDHFAALVPRQAAEYRTFKGYISRRSASAILQIERAVPKVPFEITTAGPLDVGNSLSATIAGSGWVDVRTIRLKDNDVPLDITWIADNQWQVSVPVEAGTKEYTLEAYNFQGKLAASDTISITSTAISPVRAGLRISEIQYNPGDAVAGEPNIDNDEFEFVELVNVGNTAIDLNGVKFAQVLVGTETDGVEYTFAAGSLAPNERIVVVRNRAAFESRYGKNARIAAGGSAAGDGYDGVLSNGGETLTLVDATGATIQQFVYDDAWHSITDGSGYSLELLNPSAPDLASWGVAGSWQPSGPGGGTPGQGIAIPGDANQNGVFNSGDLVLVFQAGEYEDAIPRNSLWREGDWNRDGDFTTADIVAAFQAGKYTTGNAVALRNNDEAIVALATEEFLDRRPARSSDDFRSSRVRKLDSVDFVNDGQAKAANFSADRIDAVFEEIASLRRRPGYETGDGTDGQITFLEGEM